VHYNVSLKLTENGLQPAKLEGHGSDEDRFKNRQHLLGSGSAAIPFKKACNLVQHSLICFFRQGKVRDPGRFDLVAKKLAGVDGRFMASLFQNTSDHQQRTEVSRRWNRCKKNFH